VELRALRLFVAVVEEGSIHAGARRLIMTQPAVSHALRKLEREAGGALLVRTPRGVELTPAGAAVFDRGRDILGRMDALTSVVRRITRMDNCSLRVGLIAGPASAGELTFPIISAFRQRYPDVRLSLSELSFDDQFDALVDGRVDLAIVRMPCDDDRLETVALFSEPRLLLVPAEHRLAEADAVSVTDVLDEPMVTLVRAPARWREFWELNELRGGPPPRTHAAPAITMAELQYTVLCEAVVGPATGIAWRYGLSSPLLRAVPILEGPTNEVAVAYRRAPARAWAREFASCALEVSEQMLDLVPGARLNTS
jgi:DNA-binding transcriptional LysR family regulator